jgi:hypothetical protein
MNREQQFSVVHGGGLFAIDAHEGAHAYIPCAACRGPIAIDNPSDPLPRRLMCDGCGTVLER